MQGIINNIINFYEIQAKALAVLVTNTQKALEQSEKEIKADEQVQRVENFVKDLNNMLTRFYFLKERKNRKQQHLTDSQVKAMTGFAIFVKNLTRKVCPLLDSLQGNRTFEEKIDEEIKQLETYVKKRMKEFDEVLEDALAGKGRVLIKHLAKHAGNIISGFVRIFRIRDVVLAITKRKKLDRPLKESSQNIENYQIETSNLYGSPLENLCNGLNISSVNDSRECSKNLMHLRAY